ncbi:hypothetical protein [Ornithinibacillus bavariensis]|uniref:Uncharacterized protein n=1 Tax=Ornithinibacillus bavariensis TaxID=545502 RepID=A0A920C4J6_9BACI|nr:hypothetical protein [Ornithinibacillus bavariensis]GIO25781.1 hypothetical protein J43TS3_03920 [Ornithinibacillus bavariensis]HAM79813.1 hypothetical protein [Ornithinibacillus sp.]
MDRNKLIKNLGIIEKHLERNEKWFQQPEKKMLAFEKDMDEWNRRYLKTIGDIEYWIRELEKKMEG